ncbi:MAG: site-specific DNA-methyltransferase [Flavobacteriales bacterium]|nr:site-specific DNA-methyltransferase [Flavobacteriales bacterium]
MSKEEKITNNIKVPNKDLETLRINFPHCFDKDGNFQLEKFKANLTEKEINFSTESYGLDWLGKSYARLLASDPATTLLRADETHNSKPENANSENLLIKGDNLEVLKHLANAYYEQVKMIYIDPPYNTGSDGFVYNDDRKFTAKELQNLIGIDAEKAKRILDFTKQKSNSHSAWLTFLYPRLYIAKQLLKDEGVIFVSIDDNEVAQLRLLMDEIFGEENFVAHLTIQGFANESNEGVLFQNVTEYCLCYAKEKSKTVINKIDPVNEDLRSLNDAPSGLATRKQMGYTIYYNPESKDIIPKTDYDINGDFSDPDKIYNDDDDLLKNGYIAIRPSARNGVAWRWRWGIDTLLERKEELVCRKNRNGNWVVEFGQTGFNAPRDYQEFGTGTSELKRLFDGKEVFTKPKSTEFISWLIQVSTNKDDTVLDFFAGSATTADATMQINTEDIGKRKFIVVQLPETIDPKKNKVAYDFVKDELNAEPTIFEITKERITRAANKINAGINEKITKLESELPTEETKAEITKNLKLITQNSFKIFETTPIWEDYDFEVEQFDSSQTLFDVGKLTEDDIKALLITWKTYDGISLTQDLKIVDLGGYTAYYGNGRLYLLHKNFTTENLKAVLEKIDTDKTFNPTSIIAFGYHFESKSLRELSENVKQYANKKKIDIDFITRY